ncbi:1633_t:CDS:2, partial [Dentiscutata erythropus]
VSSRIVVLSFRDNNDSITQKTEPINNNNITMGAKALNVKSEKENIPLLVKENYSQLDKQVPGNVENLKSIWHNETEKGIYSTEATMPENSKEQKNTTSSNNSPEAKTTAKKDDNSNSTNLENNSKQGGIFPPKMTMLLFSIYVQNLENIPINEIISTMYEKIGNDFVTAKPYYTKGRRTYFEVIFDNEERQNYYAAEGITLFRQTILGYISVNLRRTNLTVKLRNIPMGKKEIISNYIREIIVYKTTNDSEIKQRIPRHTSVWGQKFLTEWKTVSKIINNTPSSIPLSINNPYIEVSNNTMQEDNINEKELTDLSMSEDENLVNMLEKENNTDLEVKDSHKNTQKNNPNTLTLHPENNIVNIQGEYKDKKMTNKRELDIIDKTILDSNKNDDSFTTVLYKKHKIKTNDTYTRQTTSYKRDRKREKHISHTKSQQ